MERNQLQFVSVCMYLIMEVGGKIRQRILVGVMFLDVMRVTTVLRHLELFVWTLCE